ncbi:MAG: coniferyl-alcohol dehydrogenase [Dehalococcoidia bacterium]
MKDLLGYKGKTAVITGCATGMGNAAAKNLIELGAEVYALDIKEVALPVKKYINIDLGKKESIEKVAKQLPEKIDCLFNCAALPGPPWSNLDVTMVNFVGIRHLTELVVPRLKPGGAIAIISSTAGVGYQKRMEPIKELLSISDYAKAREWLASHEAVNDGYTFSKECLISYAKWRAAELAKHNIRINVISPGPTDTPMMKDFLKICPKDIMDQYYQGCVGRNATPEEMAEPLVFLNSNMARYISGQNICIDYGWQGAVEMGVKKLM